MVTVAYQTDPRVGVFLNFAQEQLRREKERQEQKKADAKQKKRDQIFLGPLAGTLGKSEREGVKAALPLVFSAVGGPAAGAAASAMVSASRGDYGAANQASSQLFANQFKQQMFQDREQAIQERMAYGQELEQKALEEQRRYDQELANVQQYEKQETVPVWNTERIQDVEAQRAGIWGSRDLTQAEKERLDAPLAQELWELKANPIQRQPPPTFEQTFQQKSFVDPVTGKTVVPVRTFQFEDPPDKYDMTATEYAGAKEKSFKTAGQVLKAMGYGESNKAPEGKLEEVEAMIWAGMQRPQPMGDFIAGAMDGSQPPPRPFTQDAQMPQPVPPPQPMPGPQGAPQPPMQGPQGQPGQPPMPQPETESHAKLFAATQMLGPDPKQWPPAEKERIAPAAKERLKEIRQKVEAFGTPSEQDRQEIGFLIEILE